MWDQFLISWQLHFGISMYYPFKINSHSKPLKVRLFLKLQIAKSKMFWVKIPTEELNVSNISYNKRDVLPYVLKFPAQRFSWAWFLWKLQKLLAGFFLFMKVFVKNSQFFGKFLKFLYYYYYYYYAITIKSPYVITYTYQNVRVRDVWGQVPKSIY